MHTLLSFLTKKKNKMLDEKSRKTVVLISRKPVVSNRVMNKGIITKVQKNPLWKARTMVQQFLARRRNPS
jgi:hypothetical protein